MRFKKNPPSNRHNFKLHDPGLNRNRWVALGLVACTALGLSSAPAATDWYASNGQGDAVGTMQHPSMAYHNGKTYVAYLGANEDAYVARYNHATGDWSKPHLAGTSQLANGDGHGKPTICVDNQGYIHIVYGGHGGWVGLGNNDAYDLDADNPSPDIGGKQTHRRSVDPEDITGWQPMDNVSPFGTYNQMIKMDDGDIYLFYRHGNHKADWVYQKSVNNGQTFQNEVRIMDTVPVDANTVESWYMWFAKGQGDNIVCTFVYHPCGYGSSHQDIHKDVYYMSLNCATDTWHKANGNTLSMPLHKTGADNHCLVVNTGSDLSEYGAVHKDSTGKPWLIYQRDNGTDKELKFVRWTGSAWTSPTTIWPGGVTKQDGDFMILSSTSARAIISGTTLGQWRVASFLTTDSGATWTRETPYIISPGDNLTYRTSCILADGHPNAQVLITDKISPTDPSKQYCWGASGFLQKNANVAPYFIADPFSKPVAIIGQAYSQTIKPNVDDPNNDVLTYSKVSGPTWLSVASNGALTGTPTSNNLGVNQFSVRATDDEGLSDTATMNITVSFSGPQTVTFKSIAAEDGYILESGETTDVGGTFDATGAGGGALRLGDNNQDRQYKTVVSFDTSSIPDNATITDVTLRLKRSSLLGTNPFNTHGACNVGIKNGNGFSENLALQAGDFQVGASDNQVAVMSNATSDGYWSSGVLGAGGRNNINKIGRTQLRLRFATDDNDDLGNDYMGFYSGEAVDADRPQLIVTYQ
jgi:hypothetical protein